MHTNLTEAADMIAKAEEHLEAALGLLDEAYRYDVSAHVDLALHILRNTRSEPLAPDSDISAL
jgi:hypothetical protein